MPASAMVMKATIEATLLVMYVRQLTCAIKATVLLRTCITS